MPQSVTVYKGASLSHAEHLIARLSEKQWTDVVVSSQPCNPAVGGPAKSQLVHEVDALGGEIGKMADRCYLQKRVLNRSKVSPSSCNMAGPLLYMAPFPCNSTASSAWGEGHVYRRLTGITSGALHFALCCTEEISLKSPDASQCSCQSLLSGTA